MARLRKGQTKEIFQDKNWPIPARPSLTEAKRSIWKTLEGLVRKTVLLAILGYFMILALVYVSHFFRHQLVFLNYITNPFVNHSNPESYGLSSCRNFYIQGQVGRLGVWYIKGEGSSSTEDHNPVVLYMHGNSYSRAAKHRVAIYKLLSSLGCQVVALDYRGYGDSDGYPTEHGLINDSLTVFNWLKTNVNHSAIYLWGHSLGAAVGVSVAKVLTESDVPVKGLILEAPFNNLIDAAISHPLSVPFKMLPFYPYILQEINDMFQSDEKITDVKCPVLIIHDHEDKIVKFALGKKLYEAALKTREDGQSIVLREFRGHGHTHLHQAKELPEILRDFMNLK